MPRGHHRTVTKPGIQAAKTVKKASQMVFSWQKGETLPEGAILLAIRILNFREGEVLRSAGTGRQVQILLTLSIGHWPCYATNSHFNEFIDVQGINTGG